MIQASIYSSSKRIVYFRKPAIDLYILYKCFGPGEGEEILRPRKAAESMVKQFGQQNKNFLNKYLLLYPQQTLTFRHIRPKSDLWRETGGWGFNNNNNHAVSQAVCDVIAAGRLTTALSC
jgi:hypothetical protein